MKRAFAVILLLLLPSLSGGWQLDSSARRTSQDGVQHVVKRVSRNSESLTLQIALFETPRHSLRVVDAAEGLSVRDAVAAVGGIAGINGGFFHPDLRPAGLVVSDGRQIQALERARLLSGVVASTAEKLHVLRVGRFRLGPRTRDAIQAGPFLIDDGQAVAGLNNAKRARRSVVLTDGRRQHALLYSDPVTLAALASLLATPGVVEELRLKRALNLDGGTSSGFFFKEGVNRPNLRSVRNCLVIVPSGR